MTAAVALLRGINVGGNKKVPMAELRRVLESLGCTNVRTLLNSGNAVFTAPRSSTRGLARGIEGALAKHFGFEVRVVVHTASELNVIIAENPLPRATLDASRFLVAFADSPKDVAKTRPLTSQSWGREQLALGRHAA